VRARGHETTIVGLQRGAEIKGKHRREAIRADASIEDVSSSDFDALVIPGGSSPDNLRVSRPMVDLVRYMVELEKPVAVIGHGPSLLADANVLEGRTVTSWPSIKTDLVNAGASWVDRPVVEDGNLITSRRPRDLQSFLDALLEHLKRAAQDERPTAVH
jgi:protease I